MAGYKKRSSKRSGYAYEAKTLDGSTIFTSGASNGRRLYSLAIQDALVEAILKAKELGFRHVLIHSNSGRLEQVCNKLRTPSWQEQTIMSDLRHLQQQGMVMYSIFIPKSVVLHVINH